VANNYYSADLVASRRLTPSAASTAAIDNPLARLLAEQAGSQHTLPQRRSQFDIDAPANWHPHLVAAPARLQALLDAGWMCPLPASAALVHRLDCAGVCVARRKQPLWQYWSPDGLRVGSSPRSGHAGGGRIEGDSVAVGFYLARLGTALLRHVAEFADRGLWTAA